MSFFKESQKLVEKRPFLALAVAGTVGYYVYLKRMEDVIQDAVESATEDNSADVPLIFSESAGINGMGMNAGIGHLSERQSNELSDIESQLKKASKMHAGQAKRISDLGMTTSTSTTTSSSHLPSLRDDTAGEPSMPIPAGSGLFGAKKKFSQVGGSARRRLGSVAREPSPVYGAHIDTQLSLSSSQKNSLMTEQHSDILGFSGLSAGQSGHWFE